VRNIQTHHIQEHCVKISSNSDENCRRRNILNKNHDVTIMTSSGHVTSSWSCPIDRSWPLSYRLFSGTIPLSGFVSEIFSAKVATAIITWWCHQWRHKAHINQPPSWIRWKRKYVQSSAVPENPTLGSNTKSIGRSVVEIWPFKTLNLTFKFNVKFNVWL